MTGSSGSDQSMLLSEVDEADRRVDIQLAADIAAMRIDGELTDIQLFTDFFGRISLGNFSNDLHLPLGDLVFLHEIIDKKRGGIIWCRGKLFRKPRAPGFHCP